MKERLLVRTNHRPARGTGPKQARLIREENPQLRGACSHCQRAAKTVLKSVADSEGGGR